MDIKLKFICGELEGLNSEYFVLLSCIWRAFICWVLGAATTRLSNSEFKILWLNFYLEEVKEVAEEKLAGSVGFENGRLDIKTDSAVAVSHHRAPLARIIQDCRNLSPCHCGSDK
ncbi:hypothetical protein LOK49_LG08G00207 [Camellia lanceoleosa]|uniref:Uncharacterized protein n=1 Tax=Camellia lanceoleosa TaxID=1840588 RepID=A0ACC0GR36_9ERIC|nr:hypothetical protein LOK49_LG08G00207 [Camellia lanceoleosa]